MPLGPLRTGENASTSTVRTTGGHCWRLTGSPAGEPSSAPRVLVSSREMLGARGEEKDARSRSSPRLRRHGKLASVPPPRAPARVRPATFAWLPQPRRRAWSRRRRARSGGVSHTAERAIPPSLSQPPFPRPSPQDTPEALPLPILRRLPVPAKSRCAALWAP